MGFDLTVYPITIVLGKNFTGASELWFDRNTELFEFFGLTGESKIRLNKFSPEMTISLHDDDGLYHTNEDAYGNLLTYFYPHNLKEKAIQIPVMSDWNLAIIKFLQNIPSSIPIVLFWH